MKKNTTIILILLCLFARNSFAQVMDLSKNIRYEFNNYYKKYTSEKPYFQDDYEVTYNSFKNQSNQKLNNQVLELCKSYIENEAKYLGLLRDANLRLEILNELNNSKNYSSRSQAFKNLKLENIECDVVSILGNQVFYELNFLFKTDDSSGNNYEKIDFKVQHYYLANMQNQTLSRWNPTINSNNQKKIQDLVSKKFNETYLIVTDKLNFKETSEFDFTQKSEVQDGNSSDFVNVFKKINLAEADYYWFNQGLIIQYQEYSKGSKLYGGKPFRLFFTYEQAEKIVALIPEFSFLKNSPKVTTTIKNFNPATSIQKKQTFLNTEPLLLDLVSNNISNKRAKSLQQIMYQISEDNSKRLMSTTKYEFNINQEPVSILTYDENNRLLSSAYYDYDAKNNLKLTTKREENREQEYTSFTYDERGNIINSKYIEDTNYTDEYYFYNQNYVYSFSVGIFDSKNSSYATQFELKKDGFCNNDICYYYDEKGQIISIVTSKTNNYQSQIGRDFKGRIVEIHKEDDRYNYYFNYDDLDRVIKYQQLEQDALRQNVDFRYQENNYLPFQKIKISEYGGNKTVIEENYDWIYFE
jgi:hypothetical protein